MTPRLAHLTGGRNVCTERDEAYLLAAALIAIPSAAGAYLLDEQVRAAYSAWNAAFNKGDPEAVAAFYTGDASFLPVTHDVIQGPDGHQEVLLRSFRWRGHRPRSRPDQNRGRRQNRDCRG